MQKRIPLYKWMAELNFAIFNIGRSSKCYHIGTGNVVYCAYVKKNVFYKSEFEKVSEWDTTIQDTMEEYDNVER